MKQINDIIHLLIERSGLLVTEDKFQKAAAFVSDRMSIVGQDSHGAYLEYLKSAQGADELNTFIAALAVGETCFFRNHNHWEALRKAVLPDILRKNHANKSLRFWSAGCSSGEEPYTLAICLWENLVHPPRWDIQIVATDVNREALARAKNGLYSEYSFRGTKIHTVEDYFDKIKDRYRIKDQFRQMVDLRELNLISEKEYPADLADIDVIFCRNTLMYFRPDIGQQTIVKMVGCLKDGGVLFLGHAEGSLAPRDVLKPIACCGTFVYQKRDRRGEQEGLAKDADLRFPSVASPTRLRTKGKRRRPPVIQRTITRTAPKETDPFKSETGVETDPYSAARDCYFQEDFGQALSLLIKDDTKEQKSLRELVLICLIFYSMSDLSRAESYRQQACQLSEISAEVYALEAMIKEAQGDYKGAIKANQNAIFLDKYFFAPHFELGNIYDKIGHAGKASRHFANALRVLETDDMDRIWLFCGTDSKQLLAEMCKRRQK